jgi:Holliday junction resolvase RusA-like endonuclease
MTTMTIQQWRHYKETGEFPSEDEKKAPATKREPVATNVPTDVASSCSDALNERQSDQNVYEFFYFSPMGKPRMTQRDKIPKFQSKYVKRYFAYKDEMKRQAKKLDYVVGESLSMLFFIPMPKSWSKKKKDLHRNKKHQQKPDLDNLIKAWKDIHCEDDSYVWEYGKMRKIWSDEGKIIVFE